MQVLTFGNDEFEGHNNAYLLSADGTVTLIDTGIATPDIRNEFDSELDKYGVSFEDIDRILLTHWHPDHTGLAGDIQAQSDATVYVHEADAPLVNQDADALSALYSQQRELFDEWGMPPTKQDTLRSYLSFENMAGRSPTIELVTDGTTIDVGDRELTVIHAPGHTAGLCCFAFKGETGREAFVGDAVLPKYTPNVGGADVRVDRPLARYLDTLKSIVGQDFTRVWPGHREVINAPTERAQAIIDHHRKRARRVLDIVHDEEPVDAWTVSDRLFGNLEGIHVLHGPGEAYAHLDHLERHGLVDRIPAGYRITVQRPTLEGVI